MQQSLQKLGAFQSRLVLALHGIAEADLARPEAEGKWSIKDVIAHLGDLELLYAVRIRTMLAGAGAEHPLPALAQDHWVTQVHRREPLSELLEQFWFHRRMNLTLLERLTEEELQRSGVHPDYGTITVRDAVTRIERHDERHFAQVERIRKTLGLVISQAPDVRNVVAGRLIAERSPGPGIHVRELWSEGVRKALEVELEPGAQWPGLDHHVPGPEEVYILSGDFNDGAHVYRAGTFLHHPTGSSHSPTSVEGCRLFVFIRRGEGADSSKLAARSSQERRTHEQSRSAQTFGRSAPCLRAASCQLDPGIMPGMLRMLWLGIVAIVVTIPLSSATIVVALFRSTSPWIDRIVRTWGKALVNAAGIELVTENVDRIDPGKRYILVANHYSYLDIPCIVAAVPQPIRFMAKVSLFKIPIFGWAIGRAGFIPIDRKNRRTAVQSFDLAADRIRKGNTIVIFPEEGRSKTREMRPFQRGAFLLALKSEKTIVPIAIDSTFDVYPVGARGVRPGRVTIRIGTPIETAGRSLRDKNALLEEARTQVETMLFGAAVTAPLAPSLPSEPEETFHPGK